MLTTPPFRAVAPTAHPHVALSQRPLKAVTGFSKSLAMTSTKANSCWPTTRSKALGKSTGRKVPSSVADLSPSQMVYTVCHHTENTIMSGDLLEALVLEMTRRKRFLKEITNAEIGALIHCFGILTQLDNIQDRRSRRRFSSRVSQCQNLVILLLVECVRRGIHREPPNVMFRADVVYGAGLVFGPDSNHKFVGLLEEMLAKFVGTGFTVGLANLEGSDFFDCVACALSGCAKLGYVDVGVREIPQVVLERLQSKEQSNLQTKHLTMLLTAESKLRLSDQMLGALIDKARVSPSSFNQWDLSSVVTALANVGYSCHTTQGSKTMGFLINQVSKELCSGAFGNPGCLASVVVGFGRMRYYDKSLVDLLVKGVRYNLDEFSVHQISDVLHNLARLKRNMSPFDLQRTIRPLMRDVAKTLRAALASGATLSCGQISSLCWSMSDFTYLDQELFLDLVDRWMSGQGDVVSEAQLARLVHSSAVLSIEHEPLLEYTKRWLRRNLEGLKSVQAGTSMLWALFVFDVWPLELFFPFIEQISRLERCGETVKAGDYHRIARCHSLLVLSQQLDMIQAEKAHPEAFDFVSRAKMECRKNLYCSNSRFQEEVACVVEELGFEIVRDLVVVEGCVLADISVKGWDIVVEADGPSHFAINSKPRKPHPVGSTVLRNRLLGMAGYKVLVVSIMTWRSLDSEGRSLWLRNSIQATTHQKPVKSLL